MDAAVILAGGASRRFGRDKTRATVGGATLLQRVIDAVQPLVAELVVVGPWAPSGYRHVVEPDRFHGPLRGLAFGLRHVTAPQALVLGADHPLLEPALLEWLLGNRGTADALVPVGPGGPEPLVACYRTGVASIADDLLRAEVRSVRALLDAVDTTWVDEARWRPLDPMGRSFRDVDAASDLEDLRRASGPEG